MAAGTDIEFIAVPRADDVGLSFREHEAAAFAVRGNILLDARQDFSLTYRATHVRADISVSVELAFHMKDANLNAMDLDHSAAGIRKCGDRPKIDFTHDHLARYRTRRNHIDRSNRLS